MVTIINLIPPILAMKRRRRRHLRRWLITLAVSAVGLLGGLGWDWSRQAQASRLNQNVQRIQAQGRQVRAKVQAIQARVKRARLQMDRAQALRAKRSWSSLLAMVASCLPERAWLESFATVPAHPGQRQAVVVRTSAKKTSSAKKETLMLDAPRTITMVGYASQLNDVSRFVEALKEAHVFREVTAGSAKQEPILDGFYFRFEITCQW